MSQQYKAVAALIKNTIAAVNELLRSPDDELHRLSVTNDLQRTHDKLLLLTGTGDLDTGKSTVLGPAKTIGGVPIKKQRTFTEADMVPSDDKVFKLKQDIDNALVYFAPDANAEGILANIPELIIRGVAKKAGLKVTKDEPKELTVEFIEDVKKALLSAGVTQTKEPAAALTEEELKYLAEKHTPLFLTGKPEGTIEVPESESADRIPPVNETKASVREADQATDAEAAEFGAKAAKELYDMVKEVKPAEQPNTEEPKQESKPDTKKKAGK